jgi:hypothetical protein
MALLTCERPDFRIRVVGVVEVGVVVVVFVFGVR